MVPFIFLIEAERGGGAGAATIWDPALPLQDNRHDPLHDQPRLCLQVDGQIKIEKMKKSYLVFFLQVWLFKSGKLTKEQDYFKCIVNIDSDGSEVINDFSSLLRRLFCRHCLVHSKIVQ